MIPFHLRLDEIINEVNEFNAKLHHGIHTLSEIGDIDVGASEKDPVYREDKLVLYHFKPLAKKLNPVPIMIVYALVNRPYMADLQDGRSMIQGLLQAGQDVYLIDWGYPDAADSHA